MNIRIGMEGGRLPVIQRAAELGASLLVSANSFWKQRTRSFGEGWRAYAGFDIALDSGGFVAMHKYGGYRWDVAQYVALAASMRPTWWAQMDFCCEPELAGSPAIVTQRIDRTVEHLHACQHTARATGTPPPMPVLQGWRPEDYTSGPIYDAGFDWPELVGVGSVCRRPVQGPTGLLAVVARLDEALPPHVKLHLFGVKSQGIRRLLEVFPHRCASVDSMAWNIGAWWAAHKSGQPWTGATRAAGMASWFDRQQQQAQDATKQLTLL